MYVDDTLNTLYTNQALEKCIQIIYNNLKNNNNILAGYPLSFRFYGIL